MIKYSIIIPSYNEYENLKLLIPELLEVLKDSIHLYEILVIDRMSKDEDTFILTQTHKVKYIQRAGGDRYGDAVRSGISSAIGRTIIFMDGDGSHNPKELLDLSKHSDSYDLVVSSRYLTSSKSENTYIKELGSIFLNKICRMLFKINCSDFSNSFKAYNGDLLKQVTLYSNDIDIIEEMIYKLIGIKNDITIYEIPGTFRKRVNYESRRKPFVYFLSYIKTLVRLKFLGK